MKKRKKMNVWPVMTMFLLLMVSTAAAGTIYVDADASGADNGSSWADAYNYLQDALAAAASGDEIWVAQGIYKPDQGTNQTSGDREATFQLINGVTIKGGYAGFGESNPNVRDIDGYETILSGDLYGNDMDVNDPADLWREPSRTDNSYHVVTGSWTDPNAVLDGFTITGGNANSSYWGYGSGGGMLNVPGSPRVSNCKFTGNSADDGGGMYNDGYEGECNPILINCVFSGNYAGDEDGGGMYNFKSSPRLANCTFSGNSTDDDGGAIYSAHSSPMLTNCTFIGNSCSGSGGAISCRSESSPILTNCTFTANTAYAGGGMHNIEATAALTNCIFTSNSATEQGGGLYNKRNSITTLTNCTFSGNSAGSDGGGVYNFWSSPKLTNCTFSGNSTKWYGGGMFNRESNPTLTKCTFSGNFAEFMGGGMFNVDYSGPILTHCVFIGNSATNSGGGMGNDQVNIRPILNNCLFSGNSAGNFGGGIYNDDCGQILTGCTFSGNSARSGGGIFNDENEMILTNGIFWANSDSGGMDQSAQLNEGDDIEINYCCIQGWTGDLGGVGNIDADPFFVAPGYWDANSTPGPGPGPPVALDIPYFLWVDGDYHLLPSSTCIDTGDPNYVAEPNETDLDGKPRVIGGRIDMGAYEYSPPIPAEVRIVPRSINLASMGKWITCYIWLPEDYNVADIKSNTVFLQREIQAQSLSLDEGQQVATAKFNRPDVQEILDAGEVELTITGRLTNGFAFEGTDVIRVIDKGRGK